MNIDYRIHRSNEKQLMISLIVMFLSQRDWLGYYFPDGTHNRSYVKFVLKPRVDKLMWYVYTRRLDIVSFLHSQTEKELWEIIK